MNTLPWLIAALVMLPALGVTLWAWWAMRGAEKDLRDDAGLQPSDLDIGTWPTSYAGSVA